MCSTGTQVISPLCLYNIGHVFVSGGKYAFTRERPYGGDVDKLYGGDPVRACQEGVLDEEKYLEPCGGADGAGGGGDGDAPGSAHEGGPSRLFVTNIAPGVTSADLRDDVFARFDEACAVEWPV